MKDQIFSKYALKYWKKGYSVIPVKKSSKQPIIKNWSEFCLQRATKSQIKKWIEKYPDASIGMCCGPASNLICLDIDLNLNKKSEKAIYNAIKDLIPANSIKRKGRKGYGIFFRYDGQKSESIKAKNNFHILDILSKGRQVILPPSVHPETQKSYRWTTENTLLDISIDEIPALPHEKIHKIKEIIKNISDNCEFEINKKSSRNETLKAQVVAALTKDKTEKDIIKEIIKYDKKYNTPPLFSDQNETQMKNHSNKDNAKRFVRSIKKSLKKDNTNDRYKIKLKSINDLYSEKIKINWLVKDLLMEEGLSSLTGRPKSGKSTLSRHLIKSILNEDNFLGFPVKKNGPVLYFALEEIESQIADNFKTLNISNQDKCFICTTAPRDKDFAKLRKQIQKHKPALVIIDPIMRYVDVKDANDYQKVTNALDPLLKVAREEKVHILCIHHAGKADRSGAGNILGSTAFRGTFDNNLLITESGNSKTFETDARYGLKVKQVLEFNEGSKRFSLIGDRDEWEIDKAKEKIIELLRKTNKSYTKEEIKDVVQIKTERFNKALNEQVSKSRVKKFGHGKRGKPYYYIHKNYFNKNVHNNSFKPTDTT